MMARFGLAMIVLAYMLIGAAFALATPAWQAPDEPAHYNYVAQVATRGCCPLIAPGDWDADYLDALKSARFAPELLQNLAAIQYEDHQPPLYYLLAAPLYTLSGGSLLALRLFSVALGTVIVACTYATARLLLPEQVWLALGAAAFVAFLPQNVAILASVNNDALAWALIALTLYATLRFLRTPPGTARAEIGWPLLLGALVGLIFLTKTTGYFLAGLVPLALYLRHRAYLPPHPLAGIRGPDALVRDTVTQLPHTPPLVSLVNFFDGLRLSVPYWLRRQIRQPGKLLRAWALFLLPALLCAALWWGRNLSVYGTPDFLGLRAHDTVVVGQPRTDDYIARVGAAQYWRDLAQTTFVSFWGQFGWMGLPLAGWPLWYVSALSLAGVSGAALRLIMARERWNRAGVVLLLAGLLALAAYFYYNSEFLQFQGRYLYAGLMPAALALALGLEWWARLIARAAGQRAALYGGLVLLPLLALAPLCLYLLWRVIVPGLTPQ
ncbi:MAG: glycosyltransferase family 39 protein [Chloroflexi bacterium]|nr:glycosyltransferase family 39 protein [Chloroflexota bacterium]